ncbi:MAG: ABC transporter ATP-binding protein, partial [Oscillospiraceae bacterium]|nr:ABC transporter ATP-binding protein [Oscillospiraceae bacterium]
HQLRMMELARFLAREGKTVVLVLHDLTMALEWADRLVVMGAGTVLAQGTAEEVYQSGCLNRAFGVTVSRIETEQGWKYYYG